MENTGLFDGFEGVSSKQWKQQIQYELKGADYNETLVWESPEGIKVKPFYHSDEAGESFGILRDNPFLICQDIFVHDLVKSSWRAKDSIDRGAESIRFSIHDKNIDVTTLLNALPENFTVYFELNFIDLDFMRSFNEIASKRILTVFCNIDPIGQLAKDGNWFGGGDNFEKIQNIVKECKNISSIGIHSGIYQNAGANIVQQIAYALAHSTEYLNRVPFGERPVCIEVAIGSNYFFEIAKLRALRLLFDIVAKEFSFTGGCHILAVPTKRNKTLYDYNVNMLRTTTECMSAIIGGADTISNLPYDALYHKSNEFGERISRNQLLILKNESYFDTVLNPADGSYYIESLTHQLAEKALQLFKEIEAGGGFLEQLKSGTIQRKINESAHKEQQLFDSGNEVLLGTNKYPNKDDRMKNDLELYPFVKINPRKTLIVPIIEKRLAEKMEQERIANESQEQ